MGDAVRRGIGNALCKRLGGIKNYELRITNCRRWHASPYPFTLTPLTLSSATEPHRRSTENPINPEGMPTTSWWHNSTNQQFNFPWSKICTKRNEKGKRKKEKGEREKAAGCRVAPRQRSRIEAPSGHSPIAPETGASIRPDESGLLGNRFSPKGHKMP